jgi:hypothetical protein
MTSLSELVAWLADEHQISAASADHWRSLVGDVAAAVAACGPRLRGVVLDDYEELEEELAAIRNQLRDLRGAPDRSLLRRLNRVADHLTERGSGSSARSAALDDLLEVASADDLALSHDRARALVDLGPGAGWPTREFARRMQGALQDGDDDLQDGDDEALARARQVAERDESSADRIVWLRYRIARMGEQHLMTVGPRVTLFDGDWVASALQDPSSELVGIAPEAAADTREIQSLARRHGDAEAGEERPPFVVARIEVPDVRPGEALDRARRTAESLSALGVLYGSDPGVWVLDGSYVVYAHGRYASASFSADVGMRLPAYAGLALQKDRTAATLANLTDSLGPHLPVGDPKIAEAARLLHWLQEAQLTGAPPRLLLCDRVIEQVRGWAGVGDLRHFVQGDLRLPWVGRQLEAEIETAAWQSLEELTRAEPSSEAAALFAIEDETHRRGIHLPRFLVHLDRVAAAINEVPHLWESSLPLRLAALKKQCGTPNARRRWFKELLSTFDRAEGRRRRTRNALVHGGPLTESTVESVVAFAERLAFYALGESIEGRLAGKDLVDHFLARRDDHGAMERAIADGQPLSEALFRH